MSVLLLYLMFPPATLLLIRLSSSRSHCSLVSKVAMGPLLGGRQESRQTLLHNTQVFPAPTIPAIAHVMSGTSANARINDDFASLAAALMVLMGRLSDPAEASPRRTRSGAGLEAPRLRVSPRPREGRHDRPSSFSEPPSDVASRIAAGVAPAR